jgi:hypothetical protein
MGLEGMYRKAVSNIRKRDKKLAAFGTTAGKEAAKRNQNLSPTQWSASAKWAVKNPEMSAYDNDGNPVNPSHWA